MFKFYSLCIHLSVRQALRDAEIASKHRSRGQGGRCRLKLGVCMYTTFLIVILISHLFRLADLNVPKINSFQRKLDQLVHLTQSVPEVTAAGDPRYHIVCLQYRNMKTIFSEHE